MNHIFMRDPFEEAISTQMTINSVSSTVVEQETQQSIVARTKSTPILRIENQNSHIPMQYQDLKASMHKGLLQQVELPMTLMENTTTPASLGQLYSIFVYLYNDLSNISAARHIARLMTLRYHFSEWSTGMLESVGLFYREVDPICAIPYFEFAVFGGSTEKSSSTPSAHGSSGDSTPTSTALTTAPSNALSPQTKEILHREGILTDLPSIDSLSRKQTLLLELFRCLIISGVPYEIDSHNEIIIGSHNLQQLTRQYFADSRHLESYLEGTLYYRIGDFTSALDAYKRAIRMYPEFLPYQHLYFDTIRRLDHATTQCEALKFMRPKQLENKTYMEAWKVLDQEVGLTARLKESNPNQRIMMG